MVVLLLAHAGWAWASPGFVEPAKNFMTKLLDVAQLSKDTKGATSPLSTQQIKEVSGIVDFRGLAAKSFQKRWATFKAADQNEFLNTFQQLLELGLYPMAKKIGAKTDPLKYEELKGQPKVRIKGRIEREKKGERIVEDIEIVLVFSSAATKVIDADFEGEALSKNLNRQFEEALKKKTFRQILDQMKNRVSKLKARNEKSQQQSAQAP